MLITGVRHDWPEKAGFCISRPDGINVYTFLHFTTSVSFKFGNKTILASPGACIFFPPDVPQYFYSGKDIVHNWMHTDLSLCSLLEQYNIPQGCLLYPKNTAFISSVFRKLEMEFFSDNPYRSELMESYVKQFIIEFARALGSNEHYEIIYRALREKMKAVRHRVLSTPDQKWTVEDMADMVSLSPSRFHAVYRRVFGTSPIHDVIEAKTDYARSLLLSDGELTVQSIAEKLGYNDQYHFIRQFKAVTGETPGAYRKARR